MCSQNKNYKNIADLGHPKTIWAIPAIHSNYNALIDIHDKLLEQIRPGDRVVYMGNYFGYGEAAVQTVDEILAFRRMVLSLPGMVPGDLVYLRGAQEEMWTKLLQLPFAPTPSDVLIWMLGRGLSNTLYSYGLSPHDGIEACRIGIMETTKWIAHVRAAMRRYPGHETLMTHLQRAAHTNDNAPSPLLFVHTGLDIHKGLEEQGDNFWWASHRFSGISAPYGPFQRVVRGYDPDHKGLCLSGVAATIDDGCGFGGDLVCAGIRPDGEIFQLFSASG